MATKKDTPRLETLIIATLEALKDLGGSASNEEIHDEVIRILNLPEEIVEIPHKNGRITYLAYRLHWARTYLKKMEAIDNTQRGVWTLLPHGRAMSPDDAKRVPSLVRSMNAERRKRRLESESLTDIEDEEADTGETWQEHLISALLTMQPDAFERLCQRVLREAGFTKVEVTGRSGDGGIDGHGVLRMKLVSFQVLFQAKRWRDAVGASVVRDFRGAMVGRADKGLIMTTGRFTADARREATRDGAPAIDLVDGEDLCLLLKDLGIGVKVRMVEEVSIDEAVFQGI